MVVSAAFPVGSPFAASCSRLVAALLICLLKSATFARRVTLIDLSVMGWLPSCAQRAPLYDGAPPGV